MTDFVKVELLDKYLVDETEKLGDGTLIGAIKTLTDLLSKVPQDRHGSIQFEIEHESGCYDSSGHTTVKVWYERPKTAEEIEAERSASVKHNEWLKTQQEARDRQQLAALKAKYGE